MVGHPEIFFDDILSRPGQKIVQPFEKPIKPSGHIQILYGNLSPEVWRTWGGMCDAPVMRTLRLASTQLLQGFS